MKVERKRRRAGADGAGYHELKTWPEYFGALKCGTKPFEVRRDDRAFGVGDVVIFREWDKDEAAGDPAAGYTGSVVVARIRRVFRDVPGIKPGYVVLTFESVERV